MSFVRYLDPALSFLIVSKDTSVKICSASELEEGDIFYTGDEGAFCQITHVSNTSKHNSYCIKPNKETSFYTPVDCYLQVRTCGYKRQLYKREMKVDIESFELKKEHFRHRFKFYHLPLRLPAKQYCISPYLMGYWCCKRSGSMLKIYREEVATRMRKECESCGIQLVKVDPIPNTPRKKSHEPAPDTDGFKEVLQKKRKKPQRGLPLGFHSVSYKMSEHFFKLLHSMQIKCKNHPTQALPQWYLDGSVEQRRELLSGVLDAVGHMNDHSCTFDLSLRDDELLDSIAYCARSIGFAVTKKATGKVNGGKVTKKSVLTQDGSIVKVNRMWISGFISTLSCASLNKQTNGISPKCSNVTGFTLEEAGERPFIEVHTSTDHAILTDHFVSFSGEKINTIF